MKVKRVNEMNPSKGDANHPNPGADSRASAAALLAWYDRHARTLPWRVGPLQRAEGRRPDPYAVWLSEVMLQQTTVAAVKSYFEAFTRRWPTIGDLAAAPVDAVMSAWAGLGYYARARNLHACAKVVAERPDARFPETATELKALPGIGDYTSAAIAAIAFDEPAAVVDGNVERVMTRLLALETPLPSAKRLIRERLKTMVPPARPGDFAQAMMDLGATICTPRRPACALCPLRKPCVARATGTMERYPRKASKPDKPLRRGAAFVAVRRIDGAIWLSRRVETGLLGGMAGLPSSDWNSRRDGAAGADAAPFAGAWTFSGHVSHSFTHFHLELEVWRAWRDGDPDMAGWWSPPDTLRREALPALMKKAILMAEPHALSVRAPTGRADG